MTIQIINLGIKILNIVEQFQNMVMNMGIQTNFLNQIQIISFQMSNIGTQISNMNMPVKNNNQINEININDFANNIRDNNNYHLKKFNIIFKNLSGQTTTLVTQPGITMHELLLNYMKKIGKSESEIRDIINLNNNNKKLFFDFNNYNITINFNDNTKVEEFFAHPYLNYNPIIFFNNYSD